MKLKRVIKYSLCILTVLCITACASVAAHANILKYKILISRYTKQYFPGADWRWFAAQFKQESMGDPNAVSPVGAMGLTQCMPGTFRDLSRRLHFPASATAFMPRYSIQAGIFYMRQMHNIWSSPRPWTDRHYLALASYNAGAGNLLKAQKLSGGKRHYPDIILFLPKVTGHYSKETITYVIRIRKYYTQFVTGG